MEEVIDLPPSRASLHLSAAANLLGRAAKAAEQLENLPKSASLAARAAARMHYKDMLERVAEAIYRAEQLGDMQ
jgi:hypothetical protein